MLVLNLDTHVAIPNIIAMILKCEVTAFLTFLDHEAVSCWEFATLAEFAVVQHFLPFGSPQVILENLFAILIMNYSTLEDNDLGRVPLAKWLGILRISRNHVIQRGCLTVAINTQLGIDVILVIQYLILRGRLPDRQILAISSLDFLSQVEDT